MGKVKIFVEGGNDVNFTNQYIQHLLGTALEKDNFLVLNGKNGIYKKTTDLLRFKESNIASLVLLDANGNFTDHRDKLEKFKTDDGVEFDYFLFPNHSDNGELEHLLCNLMKDEHKGIMTCFESYEGCLKGSGNYYLPDIKGKVYAYADALIDGDKVIPYNFLNKDHWDLDSQALEPLKAFLIKYLQ